MSGEQKRFWKKQNEHSGIVEGETTEDKKYTLETVACIGCCALAPCIMIDEDVEAKLTPKMVSEIIDRRAQK